MGTFLIGCAFLLLAVGCSGTSSETSKKEQGSSPEATASEEARCERTRTFQRNLGFVEGSFYRGGSYLTNDVPGCPKGGRLSGTDKSDTPPDRPGLVGKDGDDEIRGLGGRDKLFGGYGSDVIYGEQGRDFVIGGGGDDVLYGGDGDDRLLHGGAGEDVLYGGDGNEELDGTTHGAPRRDKLYCGEGIDQYYADKLDYVSGSCEKKEKVTVVE
jgi:hypothetical protein